MAKKRINEPVDVATLPNTKVLANGAVYDMDRHRIVGLRPELAEKNTQITVENAGIMQAQRQARKRELLRTSAASAVERDDLRLAHGDDAWIAEIGYNMQKKATNIDDPKMVDAARFLLQETGLSDKQTQSAPVAPAVGELANLVDALASFVAAIKGGDTYTIPIEGTATEV